MHRGKHDIPKKVFGGVNFIVVLWSMLSLLSLSLSFNRVTASDFMIFDVITLILPVIFLLVLNLIIGLSIFNPKKDNSIWLLSIIVAAAALVAINTLNTRLENVKGAQTSAEEVLRF